LVDVQPEFAGQLGGIEETGLGGRALSFFLIAVSFCRESTGRCPLPHSAAAFDRVLEIIEDLPEDQQQDLVEIVQSRRRERRREALAASIEQARGELARGEVRRGTVGDLSLNLQPFRGNRPGRAVGEAVSA
jgi:hypothetical protein